MYDAPTVDTNTLPSRRMLAVTIAARTHDTRYSFRCVILMTPDLFASQLAPLNCLLHWLDHKSDPKGVG
ncbi:hypothetical protein KC360_g55 [Hortaea werneckii]|nr:hypothetical protein KC344_g53 [Hortaea werneckii]KAI7180496.1 hypothetical protein KC360_g55 [Hortaea werneckii]